MMNSIMVRRGQIRLGEQLLITRGFSKATPKMKPFRKHPQTRENRPLIQKQRQINSAHEIAAEKLGLPWRIVSAS
jgi:hypothetical protein